MRHLENTEERIEAVAEMKASWLKERNYSEGDVLEDEAGREYVIAETESDHSATYQINAYKLFLPDFDGEIEQNLIDLHLQEAREQEEIYQS